MYKFNNYGAERLTASAVYNEAQHYMEEVKRLKAERDKAEDEESRLAKLCYSIEEKPFDEPLTDEEKATEEAYERALALYHDLDDKIWIRERLIDALNKAEEFLDTIEQEEKA